MAKGQHSRSMPRTPDPRNSPPDAGPGPRSAEVAAPGPARAARPASRTPASTPERSAAGAPAPGTRQEPEYLRVGTGCLAGHDRGRELEGPVGLLPSRRLSRMGFGLVLWCIAGAAFLADARWLGLAVNVTILWLAYSAIVQRRAGHRGRCWRTRAWRQAWGGLVPGARVGRRTTP